jgi:hypothetical protein
MDHGRDYPRLSFANNEVAFLAWDRTEKSLEGGLGFHIVREYLEGERVVDARPLASYVAFEGQSNPDWLA